MKEKKEKYFTLAECDFNCIEQCIMEIKSDRSRSPEKMEVKYKCGRDEDVLYVMHKLFEDIERNKEPFGAFNYKDYQTWKEKGSIDFDDTNFYLPNPFIRAIYYILWGKKISLGKKEVIESERDILIYENGWGRFSKSYLFNNELWGGETMNTIASYEGKYNRGYISKFIKKGNKKKVDEFCNVYHTLGNYVLVPAYFNQKKGVLFDDCFDRGLCELEDSGNAIFEEGLKQNKLRGISKSGKEIGVREICSKFKACNDLKKYINTFFLWDYVYTEEKRYCVRNLRIENEKSKNYDVSETSLDIFLKRATDAISRRSKFMAAMLMLAVGFEEESYKEKWTDWHVSGIYKNIVEKVFLKDKAYEDFNLVINEVKTIIQDKQYDEVKEILDTI